MKKYIPILLIIALVLTGCSFSVGFGDDKAKGSDDNKGDLTLQLTKVDEEAGGSLEEGTYKEINNMIKEDPKIGAANDFSVYTLKISDQDEGKVLFLLGINRLPIAIHNISFQFTLKSKDDEYVYQDMPVRLTDSEIGTFQPDGAIPFMLDLSDEQAELLKRINPEDIVLEIDDFKYKKAD